MDEAKKNIIIQAIIDKLDRGISKNNKRIIYEMIKNNLSKGYQIAKSDGNITLTIDTGYLDSEIVNKILVILDINLPNLP